MRLQRACHQPRPWLISVSLDLMLRLIVATLLICAASVFAQKWTHGSGPPQPATEAYFSRVGTIIFNTLGPELDKHPERLSGAVRVALLIDRYGHVRIQKVISSTSSRWVQDTALRVVRSVRLPPMPKEVITEQGHEPVDFQAEWSFEHQQTNLDQTNAHVSDYEAAVSEMTHHAIVSALRKEPARWSKLSMKLTFNITDDGRIRDIKITSAVSNRWAEEKARQALLAFRVPPVPKEILAQVGHNGLYSTAELQLGK